MVPAKVYEVLQAATEEATMSHPNAAGTAYGVTVAAKLNNRQSIPLNSILKAIHLLTPLCPEQQQKLRQLQTVLLNSK